MNKLKWAKLKLVGLGLLYVAIILAELACNHWRGD